MTFTIIHGATSYDVSVPYLEANLKEIQRKLDLLLAQSPPEPSAHVVFRIGPIAEQRPPERG